MRFYAVLILLAMAGCKKTAEQPEPAPVVPAYGGISMRVDNVIDGEPILLGQLAHLNPAGNPYSVSMLKYYLSNVELVSNDGYVFYAHNYDLINEEDDASKNISLDSVPNGTYTTVRFLLGIDSARNHTGVQDGDLDPINGMIWSWNTGYIFFKHEGNFKDINNDTKGLIYHYGTDNALAVVELPVNGLVVNGNAKTLKLELELNDLYGTPHLVDFNDNNIHQSTGIGDMNWMKDLRENFPSAFHIVSVQ